MSNILLRAISGAIFVAILVLGILYNALSLKILFLIISTLGLYEFYTVVGLRKNKIINTGLGVILYIANCDWLSTELPVTSIFLCICLILFILELFDKEGHFQFAALRIVGLAYIVLPLSLLGHFDLDVSRNAGYVLSMFILIWSNDTGAYLSGRALGKNKLFLRISPNKTIEGLIGGGIAAVCVSLILAKYLLIAPFIELIVMALLVFIFANLGDLVESMLKRNYGTKDSGNIIPGHGGILDRFDAVLLTIPVIYIFLRFI
ncbi:MAG: phosphatidate cytidylyltransferase [Patiriisocius sp.]|jgi:phosphatidate cytidylyltransferase